MNLDWLHVPVNLDWLHMPKSLEWVHMPANLDWLLSPITQYSLCALCLGGSLLLWLSFKKELQAVRSNSRKSYEQLQENVQDLSSSVETIKGNWRQPEPVMAAEVPVRGCGLNSRAEILRMHDRNEPVATIASAVRMPCNEIDFLLKIDRLMGLDATKGN